MRFVDTSFQGLKIVEPVIATDKRGDFVKLLHAPTFNDAGLACDFVEHYISRSDRGVIRGMHFQTRPHDHDKLVICISGHVLDVVLDLRPDQGTFGRVFVRELSGAQRCGLYIPRGCAHGFQVLSDDASLSYYLTSVYAPAHDTGIRYDSFGFDWPLPNPILSERDLKLPEFDRHASPFQGVVL